MHTSRVSNSFALFLLGAFSMTQVRIGGNIGISEIFVFLLAPFWFVKDLPTLRRDGFLAAIWLSLLTCLSCVISSMLNHTYLRDAIRGFASPYAIFAWIIVLHRMLRQNLGGYKWLFVGMVLTNFLNIFAFQTGRDDFGAVNGEVGDAADAVIGSTLFWSSHIGMILRLPVQGFYLQTPIAYSVVVPIALAAFSLLSSASGRSAALSVIGASVLILIGGKSCRRLRAVKRAFFVLLVFALVGGSLFRVAYKNLAVAGVLGEKAKDKYARQTRGGEGGLDLLMAGRGEFFVGLTAVADKPIFGFGPWAIDYNGYYRAYLAKYGQQEDFENYERQLAFGGDKLGLIPGHSHIVGFWLWYGIVGAVFWLYVLGLIFNLFRKYIDAIPQLYGYFCLEVPAMIWAVFFSPFNNRAVRVVLIVWILLARAVKKGTIRLPMDMEMEARKHA